MLDGCGALKNIAVASGNSHYESVDGVLYYAGRAGLVRYPAGAERTAYTVDSSAMLVESGVFDRAKRLQTVVLPEGLVQLGSGAFRGCEALSELEIPDSVTVIGAGAFPSGLSLLVGADSEALRHAQSEGLAYRVRGSAEVPAVSVSVEKDSLILAAGAVYTLSAAVEPADTTDVLQWFSADPEILQVDDGVIRPLCAGETEIAAVAGDAEVTIPITVRDEALWIDQPAAVLYEGGTLQLTVSFADNVSPAALLWQSDLANVTSGGLISPAETGIAAVTATLPDGRSTEVREVCIMREGTVTLPGMLKTLDEEAFRGSASIQAVILPDGMNAIGDYAFADCAGLRVVLAPDGITEIGETAFEGSPNVTLVETAGETLASYAEAAGIAYMPLG